MRMDAGHRLTLRTEQRTAWRPLEHQDASGQGDFELHERAATEAGPLVGDRMEAARARGLRRVMAWVDKAFRASVGWIRRPPVIGRKYSPTGFAT